MQYLVCMNTCTRNKQERECGVECDGSVQKKTGVYISNGFEVH